VADTKLDALPVATVVNAADLLYVDQSAASKSASFTVLQQSLGAGYRNSSVTGTSAAYAADTYLAGSAVTVPAGAWKVGSSYFCGFDLVKTGAGTAAMTIIVRMGTLGTTGDAAIQTLTWGAGTGVIDTGWFEVYVSFRTVGSGTSAVIDTVSVCQHHLAATGLISTGASGIGILTPGASAGFNSTTQTIIGVSINGGASFSGSNNIVQSFVML
jgi:hypothetical protein